MTFDLRPWKRLLAVWLPAVAVCGIAAGIYAWQTSETGGRRAGVRAHLDELETELARLEHMKELTSHDRDIAVELDRQLGVLNNEIFGNLEVRLTRILRAVGSATKSAGLLPRSYVYSASEDRKTGYINFGIRFTVDGQYRQLGQMLTQLQASPELLIVTGLGLSGDESAVRQELKISVSIATFLSEADEMELQRLTDGDGDR